MFGNYCARCMKDEFGNEVTLIRQILLKTKISSPAQIKPVYVAGSLGVVSQQARYFAVTCAERVILIHVGKAAYLGKQTTAQEILEPFPSIKSSHCLLFYRNPNVNCLIWDPEKKAVRPFRYDKSVKSVICSEKPQLIAGNSDLSLIAVTVASSDDIIILKHPKESRLSSTHHGLHRVDALHLTAENVLLAWNSRRKTCVAFRESFQGACSSWYAIKAFKPQLKNLRKGNGEDWKRIEHAGSDVYIYLSGQVQPWVLPMLKITDNLPAR